MMRDEVLKGLRKMKDDLVKMEMETCRGDIRIEFLQEAIKYIKKGKMKA